ncbi:malto-oligosyltrehalose trehalohydrolase [Dyella sp. BiH032]|uniref:malto-oligosyltrehalose trehalohydrolase n=1 Tax=Dyella sp. BiH032 TaxID=3075430 RepID=UPI0028931437|nr:malto-oligosyltrehalose trehalohydrolase [Dyella sp. BiH032]WNL44139.1 malto-oligosyltrehalose trehalohydrolase [Dyella sp. BiH032]
MPAQACRYGAILTERGVRFRLWAPAAQRVEVLIGADAYAMRPRPHGEFERVLDVPAGTAYRYRIDGQAEVPDPASRQQQGDVEGASMVVDPGYPWRHPDWSGRPWKEAVICELHAGCLGGFEGVRRRLAAIREAGYTAIELMPVAEFPGDRNWGYDGVLPYAPEASYGGADALKALVDEAHELGLMVFLDVVYNHFGPHGNRLNDYAPWFFRADQATPWGPAIDFRRAQVRRFFIDNALMWLDEFRMDGLRLDAVHAIASPAFLKQLAQAVRERLPADRHVHLVLENERNTAAFLRGIARAQWNDDGHNALHVLLTGEREGYYGDYAQDPLGRLARVLAEGFAFQGQRDRHGRRRGQPSGDLPPTAFVLFLQNHDQVGNRALGERLVALVPEARWRAAMALVALCPMVPLFFMGDEWACATPFLYFTSHPAELAAKVREGRRAEFAAFSAFASPERRARIPDPNARATFEASIPREEDAAHAQAARRWFRGLLELRARELVPRLEPCRPLGCERLGDAALAARWVLADGSRWTLAFNVGERAVRFEAPADGRCLHWEAPGDSAPVAGLPPASFGAWHGPGHA